jgi:hypothetical protein
MRVRRRVDHALACGALRSQPWGGGGLALLVFMTFWGVWVLAIGFRMSLVMLGATGAAPRGPSAPGGL